jgi:hypothetical protein
MLAFPYAPLILFFLPVMQYLSIKWESWLIFRYYSKPKRSWHAQQASTTFTVFYLASVFLIGIPAAFLALSRCSDVKF